MYSRQWVASLLGLLLLVSPGFAVQDMILSAPPREKPEAGQQQYGPLAEYLSRLLGRTVRYVHPRNWLNYQREMRAGNYDIVFDGPHFIAWRIAHLNDNVIIKLPGHLQFHLLARKDDAGINKPEDLIGKKICGISPPNLSTLSILAHFNNPVQQPVIKGVKGGMGKVFKTFKSGACRAVVLRTTFYAKKLSEQDRAGLKVLYTTPRMPNQGITLSKRLSLPEQDNIRNGLLNSQQGKQALQPTLKRFGGKAKGFVPARNDEYEGYNILLEGVIFGW
jgi:ABC-type phosphate/phosphonate transport system substrate-binding protein